MTFFAFCGNTFLICPFLSKIEGRGREMKKERECKRERRRDMMRERERHDERARETD